MCRICILIYTRAWLTDTIIMDRPSYPPLHPYPIIGDLFVMPHSAEPMVHLAAADSGDAVALYWVSDEPLLKVRRWDAWWGGVCGGIIVYV